MDDVLSPCPHCGGELYDGTLKFRDEVAKKWSEGTWCTHCLECIKCPKGKCVHEDISDLKEFRK